MRVVALAAEVPDILFHLGALDVLVGVSPWAPLPPDVSIPRVGGFSRVDPRTVLALRPDLVVLTSDVQASLAATLVREGIPILHLNPRRLQDLWHNIRLVGGVVGRAAEAEALIQRLKEAMQPYRNVCPPLRVYVEEWPDPLIYASGWVLDLVEWVGGVDVFPELRGYHRAQDRQIAPESVISRAPDVILFSWCGRPGRQDLIRNREGWDQIPAVRENRIVELPPEWFLQVGPGLILQGLPLLARVLTS